MTTSFAEIASRMDPVEPPKSLRELAARHRWLSGDPPPIISFREIAARHENPATTFHDFLWYNTFLLQGFKLSPCDIPEMLDRLISEAGHNPRDLIDYLGLSPADIIDRMQWSKSQVAKALGYGRDKILSTFSSVVDGLLNAGSDVLEWASGGAIDLGDISTEDVLDKVPLQQFVDAFNITIDQLLDNMKVDPLTVLVNFCEETLNFISSSLPVPVSTTIEIKPKPERQERANEIGQAIGPDYEIAAFCEVFEEDTQSRICSNAALSGRPMQFRVGPDDTGVLATSGLLSLTLERSIVKYQRQPFVARGQYCCDSDAWANKGILLIGVDVGLGQLEIFSTHLISGGDILGFLNPSDATTYFVQQQQVMELLQFYDRYHDPHNVAMIVGDFNIRAQDAKKYDWLVGKMHEKGMLDAWNHHRFRADPSSADNAQVPSGDTHASGKGQGTVVDLPGLPPVLGEGDSSAVGDVCVPSDQRFCIDGQEDPKKATGRIDYIFFENPTPQHAYNLDFTRVQRRPFPRTGSNIISEFWLSDHTGLDLSLIISPR